MAIDLLTFYLLYKELEELLVGSPLQKVSQANEGEFIFRLRRPGENYFLFISVFNNQEKIYPVPCKFSKGVTPSAFCMSLRKHIEGGKVIGLFCEKQDRVLFFNIKKREENKFLVIEMTGKNPNILILDSEKRYITSYLRRDPYRKFVVGQNYAPPLPPLEKSPFINSKDEFLALFKGSSLLVDLLKKSFYGIRKSYIMEILKEANVPYNKEVNSLKEDIKEKIWFYWRSFMTKVESRDIDPTLLYQKDDLNMEKKPIDWTPWGFKTKGQFPREKISSIGAVLEALFFEGTKSRSLDELKKVLKESLKKKIKKVKLRIKKQENDYEGTKRGEKLKRWADLILANQHKFSNKTDSLEIDDYYEDPPKKVTIKLNPSISISDNIQNFYNKYKKAKRGKKIIKERLYISKQELIYLEEILYDIDSSTELSDIEEIASSLEMEGIYNLQGFSNKKSQEVSKPRRFELDKGYVALVGRNSKQNEEISLKIAKKGDLWFHARQIPGSHVVLKVQKPSQPVPDKIIYKTARLAAIYSKGKNNSKVPIDYTSIKNVRKVKGQKTGQVFYTNEKTIIVNPSR